MSYNPLPAAFSASTQSTNGSVIFSNSNGVSFGLSGSTRLTASYDAIRNISAGTASANTNQIIFSNSNSVSFGANGSTVTASAGASPIVVYFNNDAIGSGASAVQPPNVGVSNRSLLIFPLHFAGAFPGNMTINTLMIDMSAAGFTSSTAFTTNWSFALYSRNVSSLSLLNSASTALALAGNANNSRSYCSQRWLTMGTAQWSSSPALVWGSNYYCGLIIETSGTSFAASMIGNWVLGTVSRFGTILVAQTASAETQGGYPWLGVYSSTTTAFPTVIPTESLIRAAASAGFIPHIVLNNTLSAF